MRLPDPERPFILETDGSRVAVGAVLIQRFDDTGLEHSIGFFLMAHTGLERNYAVYKVELYAVVRAVEHFKMFLLGKEFLLPIMPPSVISFGAICSRPPGSNAGSIASRNTTSRSNTREARTMLLQMFSLACPSPARQTSRNQLPSTKPLED